MNYETKRKRQNGRQKRAGKTSYQIWDEARYEKLYIEIERLIEKGDLPRIEFDLNSLQWSKEES